MCWAMWSKRAAEIIGELSKLIPAFFRRDLLFDDPEQGKPFDGPS